MFSILDLDIKKKRQFLNSTPRNPLRALPLTWLPCQTILFELVNTKFLTKECTRLQIKDSLAYTWLLACLCAVPLEQHWCLPEGASHKHGQQSLETRGSGEAIMSSVSQAPHFPVRDSASMPGWEAAKEGILSLQNMQGIIWRKSLLCRNFPHCYDHDHNRTVVSREKKKKTSYRFIFLPRLQNYQTHWWFSH